MKLSNFKLTATKGTGPLDWEFFASVIVTTGVLWWKKERAKMIRRDYAGNWHFVDTGKFTPGFQAEDLARSWQAQTGQKC